MRLFGGFLMVLLYGAAFLMAAEMIVRTGVFGPTKGLQSSSGAPGLPDEWLPDLVVAFDHKYSAQELLKMRPLVDDNLKYKPWIQIGNADHTNEFSVVKDGVRKSRDSQNCNSYEHKVWFFGGSTMYGIGVPWWDTIPSKLVKLAEFGGRCISVKNFGVPYHFSRQEVIYLASLLQKEEPPTDVVFLDGLNDFQQLGAVLRSEPFFTPTLDRLIPASDNPANIKPASVSAVDISFSTIVKKSHLMKLLGILADDSEGDSIVDAYSNASVPSDLAQAGSEEIATRVVASYLETRKLLAAICEGYKVRCFQFLQPVANLDYTPTPSEVITRIFRDNQSRTALFSHGYSAIEDVSPRRVSRDMAVVFWKDISFLFRDYEGIPYVDQDITHREPSSSYQEIYDVLKAR
ncbi:MAG: SGNH/GDSL hydrolase family protein [Methylocystis sp.]